MGLNAVETVCDLGKAVGAARTGEDPMALFTERVREGCADPRAGAGDEDPQGRAPRRVGVRCG